MDQSVGLDFLVQKMHNQALMDNRSPEALAMLVPCAEILNLVMVVALHHGGVIAGEDGGKMLQFEMLLQRKNQTDDQFHLQPSVEHLLRMQAVVADSAIVRQIVLSEIAEQQLATALTGLGIGHHLVEQLLAYLLLSHRLALHKLLQLLYILVAVVGDADSLLAVPSRASCLLIVALHALRDVVMDDKAYVRFVYSHAEGNGRHNHIHILHQELVLILRPDLRLQSGMVRQSPDSVDLQELGHLLNLAAGQAIDYSGFARILTYVADYILVRIDFVLYFVVEVGAVE